MRSSSPAATKSWPPREPTSERTVSETRIWPPVAAAHSRAASTARHALVVARPFDDIAGADANAYPERDLGTLVAPRDQPLNLRRRPDRVPRPAKRRHVTVAHALDDLAVIRGDRPADQRLVLVTNRVESILPERNQPLCRTDQIGEQQRDRSGPGHGNSVDPTVMSALTLRPERVIKSVAPGDPASLIARAHLTPPFTTMPIAPYPGDLCAETTSTYVPLRAR